MEKFVVKISSGNVKGLGVISGDYILTCAHLCLKLSPDQSSCCEFHVNKDEELYTAVSVTVDYSLDFMVLGSETLAGIWCSDPKLGLKQEELDSPIPVRPNYCDTVHEAVLKGFFFAPDGQTRINSDIKISPNSPFITLSAKAEPGTSGGPIFTAENHLLGILTNAWGDDAPGCGILIDDAMCQWIRKTYSECPTLSINGVSGCVKSVVNFPSK